MSEEKKEQENGTQNSQADEKDDMIKKLQEENQQLKQQVADLQKQVEKYEAESQAAARKTRAEKLLKKLEQKEITFSEEERETELKRLSELGDEAFTATEAAYDRMPNTKKEPEDGQKKKEPAKTKADAEKKVLRTDAGVSPLIVDDKKSTLESKLKNGFMAAYNERVGQEA